MKLDIRYVAGLFDGEGWITVCKMPKAKLGLNNRYAEGYVRYQLHVGVGMVYKPIIDSMQETFGGNIFTKYPTERQSDMTRTSAVWRLSSGKAADFLEMVGPYLLAKSDEAKIAIELQRHVVEHRNTLRYHPERRSELYEYRDSVVTQLRVLKRREFFSPVDDDPLIAA